MSEFKQGEKVRDVRGQVVQIEAGPFRGPTGTVYAVWADGTSERPWIERESDLSPIPPADPRVEVAARAAYEQHYGSEADSETWRGVRSDYEDTATAVLAALDAMPKTEPKRFKDSDGDTWTEQVGGSYLLTESADDLVGCTESDLAALDREYGPLTAL